MECYRDKDDDRKCDGRYPSKWMILAHGLIPVGSFLLVLLLIPLAIPIACIIIILLPLIALFDLGRVIMNTGRRHYGLPERKFILPRVTSGSDVLGCALAFFASLHIWTIFIRALVS